MVAIQHRHQSNQQSLTITTFGELATLDSADYDDVPSSDMLGQIFEGLYRVSKDNKVELGMAAEEPTVSADALYIRLNYVMQNGLTELL